MDRDKSSMLKFLHRRKIDEPETVHIVSGSRQSERPHSVMWTSGTNLAIGLVQARPTAGYLESSPWAGNGQSSEQSDAQPGLTPRERASAETTSSGCPFPLSQPTSSTTVEVSQRFPAPGPRAFAREVRALFASPTNGCSSNRCLETFPLLRVDTLRWFGLVLHLSARQPRRFQPCQPRHLSILRIHFLNWIL